MSCLRPTTDGDGRITPRDLCCSLSRVAICCPEGCVLRPRREVVAELLHKLNVDGDRWVRAQCLGPGQQTARGTGSAPLNISGKVPTLC